MTRFLHRWNVLGTEYHITTVHFGAGAMVAAWPPTGAPRYALQLLDQNAISAWLAQSDDDRTVLAEIVMER